MARDSRSDRAARQPRSATGRFTTSRRQPAPQPATQRATGRLAASRRQPALQRAMITQTAAWPVSGPNRGMITQAARVRAVPAQRWRG
jgi:hypothetical protein